MSSPSARRDAYSCRGRMGGNTNVEEIISSSQGGRGAGRKGCFRQGNYAEKRKKREEADLIVGDQLLGS